MMEQEHQIYRLTFDVDLPASIGENNALAEAESCCETYVIPTVDEVLSRFDSYNIDIESVALDLGTVRKDEIPKVLRGHLEEEIIKRLYNGSDAAEENVIRSSDPIETKESSVKRVKGSIKTRKSFAIDNGIPSETSKLLESDWMSYLFTGMLPWMYEDAEVELSEQVRQEVFSHLEDYDWIMTFFARLSTDDTAFYRFFNLLDIEEIRMLLSASFFAEALEKESHYALIRQNMRDIGRHRLLALAYSLIKVLDKVGARPQDKASLSVKEKEDEISHRESREEPKEEKKEKRKSRNEVIAYGIEEKQQIIIKSDEVDWLEDGVDVFDEAVSSMKQQLMLEIEAPENHCFADDAGLVILYPFLPVLFERLGYLDEERKFINLAMQERAAHLLRWIAGFALPHLDYQMSLEKVLCDLPLTYPIDSDIELTDLEKEEGMQVLRSVCQYWPPLNGTSPEGLQQSFMRRKAIISYEDNNWIVRVEGQTIDILLDDLPWEISLLLLPWKEEMIMVEWQRE